MKGMVMLMLMASTTTARLRRLMVGGVLFDLTVVTLTTVRAVPLPPGLSLQLDADKVEPLDGAGVIVASHHVAVGDVTADAVAGLIRRSSRGGCLLSALALRAARLTSSSYMDNINSMINQKLISKYLQIGLDSFKSNPYQIMFNFNYIEFQMISN